MGVNASASRTDGGDTYLAAIDQEKLTVTTSVDIAECVDARQQVSPVLRTQLRKLTTERLQLDLALAESCLQLPRRRQRRVQRRTLRSLVRRSEQLHHRVDRIGRTRPGPLARLGPHRNGARLEPPTAAGTTSKTNPHQLIPRSLEPAS